jgi:hypothetical protein
VVYWLIISRLSVDRATTAHRCRCTVAVLPPAACAERPRRLRGGCSSAGRAASECMAGGIDPVTAMLSDYALRPGWWMWDLALTVTSAGSAAVLLALHRQGVLRGRIAVSGMGVWCVRVLLVAAITKDPQGGAVTITGKLHLYATAASCVSLPIAGWALGRAPRTSAMAAAHPGSARTVEAAVSFVKEIVANARQLSARRRSSRLRTRFCLPAQLLLPAPRTGCTRYPRMVRNASP